MPKLQRYQEKGYTTIPEEEKASSVEDEEISFHNQDLRTFQHRKRFIKTLIFGYLVLLLWTIVLTYNTIIFLERSSNHDNPLSLYSPFPPSVIQYERVVFNQAIYGERTVYMGGSKEANDSWSELVTHGIVKLGEETASRLHDPTVRFEEEDGQYVVGVEMWHQLHCVNMMRQMLWAETSPSLSALDPDSWKVKHIDHCIDIIRQTLMCHGDIGIIPFTSDPNYRPLFNATRVCRKYEALRDWVDEHQAGNNTPEGMVAFHSHAEHLLGVDAV